MLLRTFTRTLDGEVEAAQSVSGQRIGSALEHDGARPVHLHDLPHDLTDTRTTISKSRLGSSHRTFRKSGADPAVKNNLKPTGLKMASYDSSSMPSRSG